jgi:hypothetical protein
MFSSDQLQGYLDEIERGCGGRLFTLTLHEIGEPINKDVVVGTMETRKCRWMVNILRERTRLWDEKSTLRDHPTVPMEPDLLKLEGTYDNIADITNAIIELRLSNAVELFTLNRGGSLKSYRKYVNGNDGVQWELTCGLCGGKSTWTSRDQRNVCLNEIDNLKCLYRNAKPCPPGRIICNNYGYLVPTTMLDEIVVCDGRILHSTGESVDIITKIGTIKPCV